MLTRIAIALTIGWFSASPLAAQGNGADTVGKLRLTVREAAATASRGDGTFVLHLETVDQYSCLGFAIGHTFERRGDTLAFRLARIVPPYSVCPSAIGPADLERRIRLASGQYTIVIDRYETRDQFALEITDSSFAVAPQSAAFVTPDSRVWWRRPLRSIAFACQNVNVARPVCTDIQNWLGASRDVRRVHFPSGGVNPYWPDSANTPDLVVSTFRLANDSVFATFRRCFTEVDLKIHEAVGVFLSISSWKGDVISAASKRSYHEPHIAMPTRVTDGPACPWQ